MAGTAAAFAASRAGAEVTVLTARQAGGATALTSGALDDRLWDDRTLAEKTRTPDRELMRLEAAFVQALGIWQIGSATCTVATLSGRLRPARGRDASVLDLMQVPPGVVALPRADRAGWDADALAASYNDELFARERRSGSKPSTCFPALRRRARRPDVDLAQAHDDPTQLAWLASDSRESRALADKARCCSDPGSASKRRAPRSSRRRLGKPVGETLSPPGAAAGARFRARAAPPRFARGAVLERTVLGARAGKATSPQVITLDSGAQLEADELVVAAGGLVGGGITCGREPAAVSTIKLPAPTVIGGESGRAELAAMGPIARSFAWSPDAGGLGDRTRRPLLRPERRCPRSHRRERGWLFAAGDVVADRPRTVLEALAPASKRAHAPLTSLTAPLGASAPRTIWYAMESAKSGPPTGFLGTSRAGMSALRRLAALARPPLPPCG